MRCCHWFIPTGVHHFQSQGLFPWHAARDELQHINMLPIETSSSDFLLLCCLSNGFAFVAFISPGFMEGNKPAVNVTVKELKTSSAERLADGDAVIKNCNILVFFILCVRVCLHDQMLVVWVCVCTGIAQVSHTLVMKSFPNSFCETIKLRESIFTHRLNKIYWDLLSFKWKQKVQFSFGNNWRHNRNSRGGEGLWLLHYGSQNRFVTENE